MFAKPIDLIDTQSLYNVLNQGVEYARLTDPNYLYLLGNLSKVIQNKKLK